MPKKIVIVEQWRDFCLLLGLFLNIRDFMVETVAVKFFKRRATKRIIKVILPLLLLIASEVRAGENSPLSTPSHRCQGSGLTSSEKSMARRLENLISELALYFTEAGSQDERILAREYIERTRHALIEPVDHMHDRCWNKDQLSCSMLLSTLHEMSSFLRSLERSNAIATLSRMVTRVEEEALSLTDYCRGRPWRLS